MDMRIVLTGSIVTGLVITLGVLMILPTFLPSENPNIVLLSFNVVDGNNASEWCKNLSNVFKKYDVKATVFITGAIAETNPNCITDFTKSIDIGSLTYNYVQLNEIPDYLDQLDEIKNGKKAVDSVGNIESRVFRAPYGSTDDNIYSLLTRSEIFADFSYADHYNKYYDGKFIKFDISSYNGDNFSPDILKQKSNNPIVISFDNSTPINQIDRFISSVKSRSTLFINTSDLVGFNLTIRSESV